MRKRQYHRRDDGGQDGAHRLDAAAPRTRLRASGDPGSNRAQSPRLSSAFLCLRAVKGRWPHSRPVSWKSQLPNGARRRPFYEAQDVRISILASCAAGRPDTFMQPAQTSGSKFTCGRDGRYVWPKRTVQIGPGSVELASSLKMPQKHSMHVRQHPRLLPIPQAWSAILLGLRISQGSQERSTNRMAVCAARLSMTRRPSFVRDQAGGSSGAISLHR